MLNGVLSVSKLVSDGFDIDVATMLAAAKDNREVDSFNEWLQTKGMSEEQANFVEMMSEDSLTPMEVEYSNA